MIGHAPAARRVSVALQGPRAARRRRGAALRRRPQGGDQARVGRASTCSRSPRQPDPAHARDGGRRDPRPLDGRRRRRPTGARSSPTWASSTRPPSLEAVRRELLREGQVFFVHNRVADIDQVARRLGQLVPDARIAVAHGQMDEGTLERVMFDFWERRCDVLVCTTIVESGIDLPTRQHAHRRPRRPPRPRPAPPAARARRARRAARLRLPLPPRRPRALRDGLRAPAHDRRQHRAGQRLQDRHARPRDPRRRATSSATTSPGPSPRSATTSTSSWSPRRWPRRRARRRVEADPGDARRPGRGAPAQGLRRGRRRAPGGLPPPGAASPPTTSSRTCAPSGATATGRCPPPPRGCSSSPRCASTAWSSASPR